MHFHPLFAVFVIPLAVTAALLILPYLGLSEEPAGVWFVSAKGRRIARHATTAALVLTPLWIGIDSLVSGFVGQALPAWISGGLAPFALLAGFFCAWYLAMRMKGGASRSEAVQGVFVFLVIALVVLTAAGLWFRGEGMALRWPW